MAQTGLAVANRVALLQNAAATGGYCTVEGGDYHLVAEGTWSAATLSLEYKGPNDTAIAVPSVSLTANGSVAVEITDGAEVRAVIAGGPPSGIYAYLQRIGRE